MCNTYVEAEEHVLLECPMYDNLRNELLLILNNEHENVNFLTNSEKLSIMLGNQNINVV